LAVEPLMVSESPLLKSWPSNETLATVLS